MRLRECREKAGLSQKYVALTLGVAAPSVSNWETGKTCPSRENTVKMADLYGVSVDYLLGRTDNQNEELGTAAQPAQSSDTPRTTEARILSAGVDRMPAKDRQRALTFMKLIFNQYEEYFEDERIDDDDPES